MALSPNLSFFPHRSGAIRTAVEDGAGHCDSCEGLFSGFRASDARWVGGWAGYAEVIVEHTTSYYRESVRCRKGFLLPFIRESKVDVVAVKGNLGIAGMIAYPCDGGRCRQRKKEVVGECFNKSSSPYIISTVDVLGDV